MTKSRLTEVETARGAAILCVLLIHGTSAAVADIPVHTAAYVIYDLINRLSCYAVPAFVLYSGLVLFYRHSETWSWRQTVPFYKRRLMFVLVPYVIWTYLYHLLNVGLSTSAPWSSLSDALHALLLGSSMYHLYFAVLIMQYYVLAPALLWFAYRYPNRLYGLLGFGVAVQVGAGYAVHRYELVPDPSLLSTTYFIAFVVGCCIGARYEDVMQWINRRIKWLAAAVPLTTGAFVWKQFADVYGGVPLNAFASEAIVHSYCIVTAVFMLFVCRRAQRLSVTAFGGRMGSRSFGIYLLHPAVMVAFDRFVSIPAASPWYHVQVILKIAVIAFVPLVFMGAVRAFRWSWILLGMPPQSKSAPERLSGTPSSYSS